MRIGVISDTHGFFDPKIPGLFAGVEHILHAGDIGPPAIIHELEKIAPVTAVTGNTDSFVPYQETELVELDGIRFLVHHIVDPSDAHAAILDRIERQKPDAVIFGHTHKPFAKVREGILFFNPGYAGKRRFDLKRSLAILTTSSGDIAHEWIQLG